MDDAAKKRALRSIPYGLMVAGTTAGGKVNAWTISWVTQTSFEPPLVTLAVKVGSLAYQMVKESGLFAVTVLATGQKDLAAQFFRHVEPSANKFGAAPYTLTGNGCPILADGLAWFECRVTQVVEQGDHHLFIGEVIDAGVLRDGRVLTLAETGFNYGG